MARWQPAERHARYLKARSKGFPVVVSEGDSWFDYPMYLNIIDRVDDAKRFALRRLEFSGDTLAHMVGDGSPSSGVESILTIVQTERPRFLLFSGGGNDIVGDEFVGAARAYDPNQTPEWHLDTPGWRQLKLRVKQYFVTLVETVGPSAPVFAHGYDYIVPSDRPVKYDGMTVAGPWVWPELAFKGIPDAMMMAIGKVMIDWFNDEVLGDLEQRYGAKGYFAHLDLRGALKTSQWQNEIHPTSAGFKAVAQQFLTQLDRKLAPTISAHDALVLGIP